MPPTSAYLFQSFTYTVTFAPVQPPAADNGDSDLATEETAVEEPTAAPPAEEAAPDAEPTPEPSAEIGADLGAATEETNADAQLDLDALTDVDTSTSDEPAATLIESQPFVLVAEGALTVEAPILPAWLALTTLESGDAALVGVPGAGDEGEHLVELTATDAAGVVITQSFTLMVELDPNPFRVDELRFETDEDVALESVLVAAHVEGAALSFAIAAEPEHGAITALDAESGAFTYMPAPDFAGEDVFTVEISDDWARSVTTPVTVTVNAVNDAPLIALEGEGIDMLAEGGAILTVTVGASIELTVIVTDVDSEVITVTVENLPPDLIYADGLMTGQIALDIGEENELVTLFTAEDSEGAVTVLELTWVILSDDAPVSDETPTAESAPPPTEDELPPTEDELPPAEDELPPAEQPDGSDAIPAEESDVVE